MNGFTATASKCKQFKQESFSFNQRFSNALGYGGELLITIQTRPYTTIQTESLQ